MIYKEKILLEEHVLHVLLQFAEGSMYGRCLLNEWDASIDVECVFVCVCVCVCERERERERERVSVRATGRKGVLTDPKRKSPTTS